MQTILITLILLFLIYVCIIAIVALFYDHAGHADSASAAAHTVNSKLAQLLHAIFAREVPEFNPFAFPAFVESCRNALKNVCDNPDGLIPAYWAPEFTNNGIPAFKFILFSLHPTSDLDSAVLRLQNAAETWLSLNGFSVQVACHYDNYAPGYHYFYVLYASTAQNIAALGSYLAQKANAANRQVQKQAAPKTRQKLEEAMKEEEVAENGKFK